MAKRPINEKRARRFRKALARRQLPAFVCPEHWLVTHGYAKSNREARELILAGRMKVNANKVGFAEVEVEDAEGNHTKKKFVVDIPTNSFDARAVTVVPA